MCFYRDKRVEGVALMSESQKVTINVIILLCFKVAEGDMISTFKREDVRITGADGALRLKLPKELEGSFKNFL